VNESADCSSALIEEGNISQLTNFHLRLVRSGKFYRANDLLHPRDFPGQRSIWVQVNGENNSSDRHRAYGNHKIYDSSIMHGSRKLKKESG
jgi:hypothetical protein